MTLPNGAVPVQETGEQGGILDLGDMANCGHRTVSCPSLKQFFSSTMDKLE
jgi:hypothetical protein